MSSHGFKHDKRKIKMRLWIIFIVIPLILTLFLGNLVYAEKPEIKTWLCYYGKEFGPEVYLRFDLVVLDGHNHPLICHMGKSKPIILGYISVGEVAINGYLWPYVKGKSYLIRKNKLWNSWVVDVRNLEWQHLLFENAIPYVVKEGFDGFFLDTFDSSISLINDHKVKDPNGIKTSLKQIIHKIREKYPDKFIAVNRGLSLLPEIGRDIDFLVVEDLYSYYGGPKKGYIRVKKETQELLLQQIEMGLKVNPNLIVLTLDYAPPDRPDMAREAIAFSRKRGFIPYVSSYLLNEIYFYTINN